MGDARKHTEEDVRDPILEVLENSTSMSTAEITRLAKANLGLLPNDKAQARKRENEQVIDGIIANALQANRKLCKDGLIERIDRGVFRLTPKGRAYLTDQRAAVVEMSKLFPPDAL